MREYYITFNPLDPTLSPIGPFVINAELKEEAMDIAASRFKNEHPDSSANLRDYRPPTVSWTQLHK
jgi:hypothetical protein